MRVPSKEQFAAPARSNVRPLEFRRGYVHGERSRKFNEAPPKYVMVGIDDYAFGFRAGYFGSVRAPRQTR